MQSTSRAFFFSHADSRRFDHDAGPCAKLFCWFAGPFIFLGPVHGFGSHGTWDKGQGTSGHGGGLRTWGAFQTSRRPDVQELPDSGLGRLLSPTPRHAHASLLEVNDVNNRHSCPLHTLHTFLPRDEFTTHYSRQHGMGVHRPPCTAQRQRFQICFKCQGRHDDIPPSPGSFCFSLNPSDPPVRFEIMIIMIIMMIIIIINNK